MTLALQEDGGMPGPDDLRLVVRPAGTGRFVLQGVKDGRFIIGYNLDEAAELLHARADAVAKGELPPAMKV